ncbi:hypothetical protein ATANTOWER_002985 [Ataeniobius toweri]|uniref:Fibronectin type-III domain-containing protein n=1 Tax=Ataeniobius toweri TaxID=208326 RepID=A0ABU7A5Y3_9TELE|nr:hypothetical protein [Ataeniobius toweri]
MGRVNVSNITSSSVSLQWDQGPGDLSHYRLQVAAADWNLTVELHNLNFELNNLTAGTRYNIQVFPVKCKRDLNPQNSSFYTIPGEVENLTVTSFTETSVSLSWKKPDGNYDFFQVTAKSLLDQADPIIRDNITTEHLVFDKLIQGNNYTFIFITGVEDRTMWSQERKTLACTRPAKVTKLEAFGNSDTWLQLKWTPPDGKYMEFTVKVKHGNMSDLNATVTLLHSSKLNEVNVSGLPKGSMIKLFVSAFSNCSLQGETENITTYTAPGPISNLSLLAKDSSITANWSFDANNGSVSKFEAELFLNGLSEQNKTTEDEKKQITFENLKTATNYTVAVYAVINNLRSPNRTRSIFTLPSQPTEAKVLSRTNNSLTFVWKPPVNSSATDYNCTLSSTFWETFQTQNVSNTSCCFTNLSSGSHYSFQVYTVSDGRTSEPTGCSGQTVEDKVEISLSMMCASEQSLYCDETDVRNKVFEQLKKYINDKLNGKVVHEVQGETFQRT